MSPLLRITNESTVKIDGVSTSSVFVTKQDVRQPATRTKRTWDIRRALPVAAAQSLSGFWSTPDDSVSQQSRAILNINAAVAVDAAEPALCIYAYGVFELASLACGSSIALDATDASVLR